MAVLDFELTLNRFGLRRIAPNKLQILCFRIAWHQVPGKYAVNFEINWRTDG